MSENICQSSNLLKKLHVENVNDLKATSVNNEPVNLLSRVKLNLKLDEMDTTWSFYITREMSNPVLLGWDFVQGNNITIDGPNSEMYMGSSIVQFLPVWKILPRVCSTSLKETVVIPPRSEMIGAAKLEPVTNHEIGVLEVKDVFKNDTVFWSQEQRELCHKGQHQ